MEKSIERLSDLLRLKTLLNRAVVTSDETSSARLPISLSAQLAEVRRRIAEVESGKATLIPGDEVLERARRLLAEQGRST